MKTARRHDIDWLRVITIALLLIYHIAIIFQPWAMFVGFKKRAIFGKFVDPDDHAQCLAYSYPILRIRHGALFCHAKTKLETVDRGADQKDFVAVAFWYCSYCSFAYVPLPKILQTAFGILSTYGPPVVFGQYFCLCADVFARFLLVER